MSRGRGAYVVKRLIGAVITIFVVISAIFFLQKALPGDPFAQLARNPRADPAAVEDLRREFGVGDPVWKQYLKYVGNVVQGNLGISTFNLQPVAPQLWEKLKITVPMVALGEFFAILLGIATGVAAATRRRTGFDYASTGTALTFYSFPTQWFGLMLILLFATTLGWFPTGGRENFFANYEGFRFVLDTLWHMILPALTIGLVIFGEYTIVVRSAMLETLGEDFIQTARAKGLSKSRIIWRHAFRNASLPIVTLVALSIAYVVSGALLVEVVFNWPGIGLATQEAIEQNDSPMLMGATLVLVVAVIVMNMIADLLYFRLDPRITE
ncbi:MAG: ABC transporter permease [Actinomycetota bacterium]